MNKLIINRVGIIALGFHLIFLWQFLVFPKVGEAALIICMVVSLVVAIPIRWLRLEYTIDDRLFASAFLLFVLVSLFTLVINPISDENLARNELLLTFLLMLPFYYLMRVIDIDFSLPTWGFIVTAVYVGVIAIYQLVYWNMTGEFVLTGGDRFSQTPGRPSGSVNPMRFGAITLCLAVICLNALLFLSDNGRFKRAGLVAGVVFALVACILAQARGAWLAIPVLAVAYVLYLSKHWSASRLLVVVTVVMVVMAGVISTPQFQKRFQQAIQDIQSYQSGNANTSLGARFDMARAAWILIKEKPVIGHGLGSYKELATEIRLANPTMSHEVGMWKNPHNEILLVMVERGIAGLISIFFLFGALGFVYWKYAWNENTAFYAVSGLGILIVYGVVGQSVALFEHEPFIYFFISTQALLMARMLKIVHGGKGVGVQVIS